MEHLKKYYTTVYAVVYSSCGCYLAAANSYGYIAIFKLSNLFESDVNTQLEVSPKYPVFKFSAHVGPIYSLMSTKQFLISGGVGELKLWKWSDVKKKEAKSLWTFFVPQGESLTKPEINSLVMSKKENEGILFAGCGDNKIYCLNIEKQSLLFVLEGHTDYIHCIDLGKNSQECVSGSEDGTVRVWDSRKSGNAVHVLEPHKHQIASRPEFGKWIGCVALDSSDEWLVCGGAPNLCVWHLRSLAPSTQFLKPQVTTNVVCFYDDMIISGGSESFINHWSLDGKLQIEVPSSSSSVFCLGINSSSSQRILAAGGSSYKIDLCTDFRYKNFSLFFCDT
ncbi:THO complex subunit 6 homolog [Trichonephila inaurata madagascariensis]|uniref:THO complex subunit 6 homolog n=1 Tax=Trichonephila inaurata madagascariensis TaxID=2747483 RepID=A0A8X7C5N5_9ARAC|nr:THO complex subunit 6 homolog [Trichonephila inaurata madagascariensis]